MLDISNLRDQPQLPYSRGEWGTICKFVVLSSLEQLLAEVPSELARQSLEQGCLLCEENSSFF